jgi:tRNA(fMet)-specific endonuclease VapC
VTAFDTDAVSLLLAGDQTALSRAAAVPASEQAIPVVVLEEIMRGRLNSIRRAESGHPGAPVIRAYELFERTFVWLRSVRVLAYDAQADQLFQEWRRKKLRIATHDLRIGAICVASSVTLVSRNRRDFDRVPGLTVEYW